MSSINHCKHKHEEKHCSLIDLPNLILGLRRDLCESLGFDRPDRWDDYLGWLVTTGKYEYAALLENAHFIQLLQQQDFDFCLTRLHLAIYRYRSDVQCLFPLPQQRVDFLIWFYRHGVGEHDLWPFLSQNERNIALQMAEEIKSPSLINVRDDFAQATVDPPDNKKDRPLPFGVNLIGYAFGQIGIGEDLRMTARALKSANIQFSVVNFSPGHRIPDNDRSMTDYVCEIGPFAINIFCMTAEETGRFYAEQGIKQFIDRYNIGYWPWELSHWPQGWQGIHSLLDEAWVSTQYIYHALRPSFKKSIHVMPLVVAPEDDAQTLVTAVTRRNTRKRYGLPSRARLFCFSFDLSSSMQRKNPVAILKAFSRAFPLNGFSRQRVGLVIKTHAPLRAQRNWQQLKKAAAQDNRIFIIEDTMPRSDLMALYAACDCYVSLHRAEGFGRGIAEALQLGLHVVTTGYGGNMDFCRRSEFSEQVSIVDYRLVKVKPGHYPHAEGQFWASPSVALAARAMRQFVESAPTLVRVPCGGWSCFSPHVLGKMYAQRLAQIYDKNYLGNL